MSAVTGYVLGYEDGRSAAEISRRNREIVDRVFYGQRTVEVDQQYLLQLQQLVEKFRADSDHNFDKADLFHREALEWKADAERHEARAAALEAQVALLQAQLVGRPRSGAGRGCSGAGRPSVDPRRKVGPQPLPADRDLAHQRAYRRPKRPTSIRRNARHGQGRHRCDRARRTFPRLPRRAGEKGAASGAAGRVASPVDPAWSSRRSS